MMKRSYLFYSLTALLALSCGKFTLEEPQEPLASSQVEEPIYLPPSEPFEVETVEKVFDGTLEPDPTAGPESGNTAEDGTKAYVEGSAIYWQNTDQVGVFDNLRPTKHIYTVSRNASNPRYATLIGSVTDGSTSWYAVYPKDAIAHLSDGVCEVTLPHVQRMGSKRVDPTALISVATAGNMALSFRNVYALLSFKVSKSDITHIQIIGNQGSVLAGTVMVNATTGAMTAIKDPKTEIHIYPSGECFETGVEYYVPILPYDSTVEGSTYLDGFTIIMYTSSETVVGTPCYVKRTDKTLSLARGAGQRLGNLTSGTGYSETTLASSTCSGYYNNKLDIRFPGGSSHAYRVALYRDEACTDLVVAHNLPASSLNPSGGVFISSASTFTFGSLEPNTQYWFRGIDRTAGGPTGGPTVILTPHVTLSYVPMEMARSALADDVILQEDFSECCYGASGDATGKGGPYRTAEVNTTLDAFVPFAGEVREGEAYYKAASEEIRLFPFARNILGETRLSDWAEYSERSGYTSCDETSSTVCARNGLLKIGASKYTGGIVTPPIQCIPAGKKAVVTVTLNARGFGNTEKYLSIRSVDGKVTTLSGTNPYINPRFFQVNHTYDTKSATLVTNNYGNVSVDLTVYPGSRILIAADRSVPGTTAGTDECRFYLGRVTLKIKSLSDASTSGSLTFSHIGLQSARVNFPTTSGHTYQAYIDGSTNDPDGKAIATVTGNGSTMYKTLSHLYFGTTYQVRVRDVTASTDVGTGYVTTARLYQNKNSTGQRFISIGWDQLYRTEPNGTTQAYELDIWKDRVRVLRLNPIQPGQANTEATIFGNSGVLGWGYQKDGTTFVPQGDSQGGALTIGNYLTPIGVSIGGLEPNARYDVRVRPVGTQTYDRYDDSGNLAGSTTVAHQLMTPDFKGNSPNTVPIRTDPPRVAPANELLWCGFEDFCVQADFSNRTVGSIPYAGAHGKIKREVPLRVEDLTASPYGWNVENPLCMYAHNTSGHQVDTWRLGIVSKNVDSARAIRGWGASETPADGGINNVVVGDFADWYCNEHSKLRMGQLLLVSNTENAFVNSPKLTDSFLGAKKLSPTGTACTLRFFAVETLNRNASNSTVLTVRVWRAAQSSWEDITNISATALRPWGDAEASDMYYYKNDYSKRPSKYFSVDMTLYPGDAVRLEHSKRDTAYGVIVDDIQLLRN